MTSLLPLFVGGPLLVAGVTMFAGRSAKVWPLVLLMATLVAQLAITPFLLAQVADGSAYAESVSGWVPGIAIPFVLDPLSALMLLFTGFLTVVCSWYAIAAGLGRLRLFAPLVLSLTAGVNGVLLTADIFNLFVFIEVMLLPSYGLLVLARRRLGTKTSVKGARVYVTFNLFVSTLLLAGVGLVYAAAGTVNLAELAGAAARDNQIAVGAGIVVVALMMKAAVVPTHGWLTQAYPSTSPAITAMFSGLHTKVAIYGVYRIYSVVFDGDTRWLWIGAALFTATMVIGVLGAVGQKTTRSILAYHMVSQIGYILIGIALFTQIGIAAGLFYLLHHMVVKASLFLSTGAIEDTYGTGTLGKVSGLLRKEPVIAVSFAIAAASLAGLPPFSGFVAKLTLIVASIDAGQLIVAAAAILVSLITLQSMLKIWNGVFVPKEEGDSPPPGAEGDTTQVDTKRRIGIALAGPAAVTATVTVVLGFGATWLLGWTELAAAGLIDPITYIEAVLG